jgi:hypothetical protein
MDLIEYKPIIQNSVKYIRGDRQRGKKRVLGRERREFKREK